MPKLLILVTLITLGLQAAAQDEIVPFTSSNLPIIVINTGGQSIQDEPKITVDMGIIDNGAVRNNLSDPYNNFSGKAAIEFRGSSSQGFPKKQYGFELRDAGGLDLDAALLGMPAEEDWILFAPYNDKSLMRDALAYKLGRALGHYSPRTKFCELVINGTYQGVYVLMEKIKHDPNRVDIATLKPDEISGNNVSGGYIIKIDKSTGNGGDGWFSTYKPAFATIQDIFFQYEYPKSADVVSEQRSYIQQFVKQFEDVLAGTTFADPVNGYAKYIDVNSFVDFFIMQEVTKNVDGYRLSTYLHKQKDSDGGKIAMGPIWDFNLGFGNADYCTSGNPEGFVLEFNSICSGDTWLIPFWWERLLQDNAFRTKVATRWAELRSTSFKATTINTYVDSVATVLNKESQQRNFTAWKVLDKYVWPNYFVGKTFQSEVDWLKSWITARLTWLDQNMPSLVTGTTSPREQVSRVSAYPNPFTGTINFEYTVEQPETVNLKIVDALGRTIHTVDMQHQTPGTFIYPYNHPDRGAGVYYYTLTAKAGTLGRGMISRK